MTRLETTLNRTREVTYAVWRVKGDILPGFEIQGGNLDYDDERI